MVRSEKPGAASESFRSGAPGRGSNKPALTQSHLIGRRPELERLMELRERSLATGVCVRLIGEAGTAVFLRLTAFILLCLGVQIVWDGVSELLLEVLAVSPHLTAA